MVAVSGCTTQATPTDTNNQTTTPTLTTPHNGLPADPVLEVNFVAIEVFKSDLEFGRFDLIADFYVDPNAQELTPEQRELVIQRWEGTYGTDYQDYSIVSLYISPPQEQDVSNFLASHDVKLHYKSSVQFLQQRGDGPDAVSTPHRENFDVLYIDGKWRLLLTEDL